MSECGARRRDHPAEKDTSFPPKGSAQKVICACGIGLSAGGIRSASLAPGLAGPGRDRIAGPLSIYLKRLRRRGYVASALQCGVSRGRETGGSKLNEGPDPKTLFGQPRNFYRMDRRERCSSRHQKQKPTPGRWRRKPCSGSSCVRIARSWCPAMVSICGRCGVCCSATIV